MKSKRCGLNGPSRGNETRQAANRLLSIGFPARPVTGCADNIASFFGETRHARSGRHWGGWGGSGETRPTERFELWSFGRAGEGGFVMTGRWSRFDRQVGSFQTGNDITRACRKDTTTRTPNHDVLLSTPTVVCNQAQDKGMLRLPLLSPPKEFNSSLPQLVGLS